MTRKTTMTYTKFLHRWEEVTDLPPQSLGPFTSVYKRFTKHVKVMPWPWFIGLSVMVAAAIFIALGPAISYLVTLLQRGF